ncbi:hypothetical protein EUX98_g1326 [Antrodiella citrinella]|uniref:Uncharacterized protein n=1 Tax=Antrodiella citrinella TaxID=2447956 RepID=A0A4S4N4N1_9APHY|nr:hypothetical protein EUX98_g1326 [Antrodiella citrinella]
MIRRSGTAPLKVEVIYWDAEDPRDMIATLQELYRIQEFITSMYANPINADSFPQLKTLELGDAPLLRRLWLNGSSIWFSSSQTASPTFGSLQELLYREVPREVEFRSLLRPTLTHVSLELLSGDESALDLLQALRGMECLQFLALLQMSIAPVPPLGWLDPQTWVCVTLPRLRRLDLRTASCKPWINFLRHLSVPLSARFLISFTSTMKPQATDICAFLRDKVESLDYKGYQPGVLWPFSSFAVDRGRTVLWTADSAYNISSSERFSSHSDAEEMSWYSYIHFWLSHSNPALRLLSAATALSAFRLPSSGVRALYYKWQESEIPSRVALENMRHVETLCVTPQEYVPQDLCVQPDAVGCDEQSPRVVTDSDVVSGEPSVHPRALFPKLKTLIILRSSYKQVPYPHWKEWWCKLISSLASRRDSTLVPQVKKLILVLPPPRPNAELLTKTNVRDVLQVVTEFVEVERGSDTYREVFRVLGESGQCPHGFRNFVESRV